MIVRDSYGIIVQQPSMDGGDSASRTGIMALCGSIRDQALIPRFDDPALVRHPYQKQWNDPALSSRDLLVCYSAGAFAGAWDTRIRTYTRQWFINKDFLGLDVRLFLYKCAEAAPPVWLELLAPTFLFLSVWWNARVKPDAEQNQIVCICIVMGRPWIKLLNKLHPDLPGNITAYWSGWRDQAEIGVALNKKIQDTINT